MDNTDSPLTRTRRRTRGNMRTLGRTFVALVWYMGDAIAADGAIVRAHWRAVVGLILLVLGLVSFASDRYCDGSTSVYAACTRPATYYYYPWWAVLLILVGSVLILLWRLRTRK